LGIDVEQQLRDIAPSEANMIVDVKKVLIVDTLKIPTKTTISKLLATITKKFAKFSMVPFIVLHSLE
jgi:hypothetical protein